MPTRIAVGAQSREPPPRTRGGRESDGEDAAGPPSRPPAAAGRDPEEPRRRSNDGAPKRRRKQDDETSPLFRDEGTSSKRTRVGDYGLQLAEREELGDGGEGRRETDRLQRAHEGRAGLSALSAALGPYDRSDDVDNPSRTRDGRSPGSPPAPGRPGGPSSAPPRRIGPAAGARPRKTAAPSRNGRRRLPGAAALRAAARRALRRARSAAVRAGRDAVRSASGLAEAVRRRVEGSMAGMHATLEGANHRHNAAADLSSRRGPVPRVVGPPPGRGERARDVGVQTEGGSAGVLAPSVGDRANSNSSGRPSWLLSGRFPMIDKGRA